MPLKFRLKGLAETFVERICCPECGHEEGEGEGEEDGLLTEHTRVTYDGIIVVVECKACGCIFVPEDQRLGVIDARRLRAAVEDDSSSTGQPIYPTAESVRLEVERLNAERCDKVQ